MKCEFSLPHYKECIELAKDKGYSFVPVKDHYFNDLNNKKFILMRHDVDFSLEYAYELANFEYDLGICATYYIYLHSELYNALSPKSMGMIREMNGMGHEIGLHYNANHFYEYDSGEWGGYSNEEQIIQFISGEFCQTASQHLPGLTPKLGEDKLLSPKHDVKSIPIKFISDSGRNWREGCMCNHIGKIDKLHILVHPEWWVSEGITREDAVHKLWQSQLHTIVRNMTDIKQMLVDYVRDDLKQ